MANTFFGLNIGTLGLYAANINLNVTANNIDNEYTEGYSRQVAKQEATLPLRVFQRYGMIGSGVEVTAIERMRSEYYDVKYRENMTRYGQANSSYYNLLKIENLFNESTVDGFTEEFDNLYDSVEELSKNPSDLTTRNNYLNYMQSFLEYIQEIKSDLMLHQEDINAEISDSVTKINSIAQEIASLNKQINVIELTGAAANELRDRREVLLDEISQLVEVQTNEKVYENGKSEFTVEVGGMLLVNNFEYSTLEVVSRTEQAGKLDSVGLYDIQWSNGMHLSPVEDNIGGSLKGLFYIRDGNNGVKNEDSKTSYICDYKGIPYYMDKIENFLKDFTDTINSVHAKGQNLYGDYATDANGDVTNPIIVVSPGGRYSVNETVKDDLRLMATAYNISDGVSQNDLMFELINTKNANSYDGGTANEYLQTIVTEIAVDTRKQEAFTKYYTDLENTIENQRLSIMGVDKDEEAMNLVKFREAYELSSKVISVMAQIYDKLINETGV